MKYGYSIINAKINAISHSWLLRLQCAVVTSEKHFFPVTVEMTQGQIQDLERGNSG